MVRILLILFSFQLLLGCSKPLPHPPGTPPIDVVLVGGGVMSATLGTMLKELNPQMTMEIYEKLDAVAEESSSAWNNAGTGHSAFCELNYTPELEDGTIETKKAVDINEQFEISKQFWAYQVQQKYIENPKEFINNVPHMSFVTGEENIAYLKKRYEALQKHSLFYGMEYTEDAATMKEWAPLIMKGRDPSQKFAATRMQIGTDVNFGALTRNMIGHLTQTGIAKLYTRHEVKDIKRNEDQTWAVTVKNLNTQQSRVIHAKFVFIGAGGGALPLLEKSGIPEAKGFGGVPVGGQWLVTTNQELIEQHQAKVYGKASVGSPPMSVPHLDTRVIDGKKALLFGPFATFSTKFLKKGSWWDLPASLNTSNLVPMIEAGLDNIPLTRYLIGQVLLTKKQRLASLQDYFPEANLDDWTLQVAGQRVQIVKDDAEKGGILQFGTEVVSSADGTIAALLGASPGASTAAPIMLKVIAKSFKTELATPEWQARMKKMIPSYGLKLNGDIALTNKTRQWSSQLLQLSFDKVPEAQ